MVNAVAESFRQGNNTKSGEDFCVGTVGPRDRRGYKLRSDMALRLKLRGLD